MAEMSTAELALRRAIIAAVEQAQGIKATDLAMIVISAIGGESVDGEFVETLEALIKEGEIVEIEYTLPEMPWRTKSFLLPKGSRLRILALGDPLAGAVKN